MDIETFGGSAGLGMTWESDSGNKVSVWVRPLELYGSGDAILFQWTDDKCFSFKSPVSHFQTSLS